MTFDYNDYIGIPWVSCGRSVEEDKGLDCWGLVYDIYQKKYNVTLPRLDRLDITTGSTTTRKDLEKYYPNIKGLFFEPEYPMEGDILLFKQLGEPLHVGLAVDKTFMIHTQSSTGCVVENFKSSYWKHKHYSTHRLRDI